MAATTVSVYDLDNILWNWAGEKLGSSYTVEKVDTSKIKVSQMSVLYQSTEDWWGDAIIHEEIYDNDTNLPVSYQASKQVKYQSKVSWTLIKAFKSSKLLPTKFQMEYPVAMDGKQPLKAIFDSSSVDQSRPIVATDNAEYAWDLNPIVSVKPYSTTRACAEVRTCKFKNVFFTSDIQLYGLIKIVGHKKGRGWTKQDHSVSIADCLSLKDGFRVVETQGDSYGPTKMACFTLEGICNGEVAIELKERVEDLQSLV